MPNMQGNLTGMYPNAGQQRSNAMMGFAAKGRQQAQSSNQQQFNQFNPFN